MTDQTDSREHWPPAIDDERWVHGAPEFPEGPHGWTAEGWAEAQEVAATDIAEHRLGDSLPDPEPEAGQ